MKYGVTLSANFDVQAPNLRRGIRAEMLVRVDLSQNGRFAHFPLEKVQAGRNEVIPLLPEG